MMIREYTTRDKAVIDAWWDLEDIEQFWERPTDRWSNYVVESADVICQCLEHDGEVCGLLQCDIYPEGTYIGVVTHPHHRRKGYAKELINNVIPLLRERGITEMFASEEPENAPSIALIASLGFVRDGVDEDGFLKFVKKI